MEEVARGEGMDGVALGEGMDGVALGEPWYRVRVIQLCNIAEFALQIPHQVSLHAFAPLRGPPRTHPEDCLGLRGTQQPPQL